jgi:hypothetical protein
MEVYRSILFDELIRQRELSKPDDNQPIRKSPALEFLKERGRPREPEVFSE